MNLIKINLDSLRAFKSVKEVLCLVS